MIVREFASVTYVLLDFEGLGSFERSAQEDMLLSVRALVLALLCNALQICGQESSEICNFKMEKSPSSPKFADDFEGVWLGMFRFRTRQSVVFNPGS